MAFDAHQFPLTADILDYAKSKKQITDKNERAGRAVWEYGLLMLRNGVQLKSSDDRRG